MCMLVELRSPRWIGFGIDTKLGKCQSSKSKFQIEFKGQMWGSETRDTDTYNEHEQHGPRTRNTNSRINIKAQSSNGAISGKGKEAG